MAQVTLDALVEQAMQLSAHEKLMLIERVSSAMRDSLDAANDTPAVPMQKALPAPTPRPISDIVIPDDEHWGENLVALVNSLDLSDWEYGPDDIVEYVRQMRERQYDRLKPYWEGHA